MKKKSSDSPKNTLKKQLVSGGVYIALSAVAVAVTVNTVMNMMPKNDLPDLSESLDNVDFKLPTVPQYDFSSVPSLPMTDVNDDTSVSRTPSGVSAEIEDGTQSELSAVPSIPEVTVVTDDNAYTQQISQSEADVISDVNDNETTAAMIFIKPCDGFVTVEHSLDIPVYSATFSDYRTHNGIDIAVDKGCLVKAVQSGTVTEIITDDLYGNTLRLETENGYCFVYSNLDGDFPEGIIPGAEISVGTVIAGVGDSAISEASQESHLHFEAYCDGKPIDPCSIIEF